DKRQKTPYPWEQAAGANVCQRARKYGLIIRPIGDVVIFMPPLASTVEEIEEMLSIIERSIREITQDGWEESSSLQPTDL
ncbi:MAG: bioK, partial [Sporomusa sp.]|nr:bioK [Sporomusa sp.]